MLRWGIIGLGRIAHSFVQDLLLVDGMILQSVASRSLDKAKSFRDQYGAVSAYGSYDEIYEDPSVDIIYVATPHDSHEAISIHAMNAGKHVLCEKPMAVNRPQVENMIEASQRNKVFLMEALWSRFNPSIEKVLELIQSGAIGDVNYMNADFTYLLDHPPPKRIVELELAGGALLDLGVYPIFLAYSIFGYPNEIKAIGRFLDTGADGQAAALLLYDNGIASVMSGLWSTSDCVARIHGTKGRIHIHGRWHESKGFTLIQGDKETIFDLPTKGRGFTYEIEECGRCISVNKLESEKWSHQSSHDIMAIMDEIRGQIGLVYPFEKLNRI